jgi:hypothetical protein
MKRTDGHPDEERRDDRDTDGDVPVNHHDCRDGTHKGDNRANRQVNPSGDDNQKHARRQDENVRVLQYDVVDVHRAEEDSSREELKEGHYQNEGNHHAVLADIRPEITD